MNIKEVFNDKKYFELDVAKNITAARLSIKPKKFSRIFKHCF